MSENENYAEKLFKIVKSQHFTLIGILSTVSYFGALILINPDFFDMIPLTITDYFVYFLKLLQVFVFSFIAFAIAPIFSKLLLPLFKKIAHHMQKIHIKRTIIFILILIYLFGAILIFSSFYYQKIWLMIMGLNYCVVFPFYFLMLEHFAGHQKEIGKLITTCSLFIIVLSFMRGIFDAKYQNLKFSYDVVLLDGKILQSKKVWAFSNGLLIEQEDKNKYIPWPRIADIQTQREQPF